MKTKNITKSSLFAAVISICSVISLNIGAIPVTLGIFAVLLAAIATGKQCAAVSTAVYILIGAAGLPVFSGFRGGFGVLLGAGGGYILSYIFVALIVGAVSDKTQKTVPLFIASVAALGVCYLFGTVQYSFVSGVNPSKVLFVCVYPFILPDIVKCTFAIMLGKKIRKLIK